MPFIKFFRCNVRHAVALVIYFSFYLLISLHFSFHLSTFREYSFFNTPVKTSVIIFSVSFSSKLHTLVAQRAAIP